MVSNAADKLQFHAIMHIPCYHHCTTTCATCEHKGHPPHATRTVFNAKSIQLVLHAPHSMQSLPNLCYTHQIQHKGHPPHATTPYSMQRVSNRCYMHHIQCKVFPTCATHQCKVYTGQMIGCLLFCQFNSLSHEMTQAYNLFKIS